MGDLRSRSLDGHAASPQQLLHITHARQDEAWVQGVLIPALGLAEGQFWTHAEDDLGSPKLLEEIERAVESCRYTLLVASSAARADEWTQFAGLLAQHLGTEEGKPRLIVVTRDFAPDSERARDLLPLRQRCLVCLDCSDPEDSATALARLAAQLALTATEDVSVECPYPGLRMFGVGDPGSCFDRPDLFFGRDEEGHRVVDQLRTSGRALLVGPSGCGKSSLVRARVLPKLGHGEGAMAIAVVRPGRDADGALRAALESLDPQLAEATDACLVGEDRSASVDAAAGPRRLVYVDQFEEVFLDDSDEHASRGRFLARLAALVRMPGIAVLLGMRADFYGDLMRSAAWDDFKDHRIELAPLRGAALREAIVRPAEWVGVHVEVDLVERLVREADQDRAAEALPLLQVALEQLWAQREWRYLSLASYARLADGDRRGLDVVLARHADDSIAALAEPMQNLARRVLIDLVHLGEGRPDTRRRRRSSELRRAGDDAGVLGTVLAQLSARRLIAVGAEAATATAVRAPADGGVEIIERHVDLAHDTLITGWPALAEWVAERRDALRNQRRLEARASGGLLDASELPEFTRWLAWIDTPAGQALGATEALRALVRRSVARRRFRRGAFGIGLVVAVTFAIVFRLQTVDLREERTKTQRSISQAAKTAEMVVFDVEGGLRTVAGASGVREKVLKRARELLAELRQLGSLAEDDQRTGMAGKMAEGEFALERGHLEEAAAIFQEVLADAQRRAARDPDHTEWQRDLLVSFIKLGDVAVKAGQLDTARGWFEQSLAVIKTLAAKDKDNTEWQRDLSGLCNKLGNVGVKAGQFDAARGWFEQSLAVIKALAAKDKDNAEWQRDLSVSFNNLGDVAVTAGQLDAARGWFEQSLAVIKTLAAKDKDNADLQRGLSTFFFKLGDVAFRAGQLDAARGWFEQSLAVIKPLAAKDKDNTEWQRDLSLSYVRLGDVAVTAGQLDAARGWFEQSLAVIKTLAAKDKDNTEWQRDLSISYDRLGDVAVKAGQLDAARGWFEQSLAVIKTLAAKDKDNADWQRDLSISYDRLGEVALMAGQLDAARGWFEQSLTVRVALVGKDKDNAEWQRDLSVSCDRLGDVAFRSGQFDAAYGWFEQSLAVIKTLAAMGKDNFNWQRDLSVSFNKLGDVAVKAGQLEDARGWFEQSLAVIKTLAAMDKDNADWQRDLSISYDRLGEVAVKAGQLDAARGWFEQSLTVREALAAAKRSSAQAQYDLLISHLKLASSLVAQPMRAAQHIDRAAAIYAQLRSTGAFAGEAQFAQLGKFLAQLRGR